MLEAELTQESVEDLLKDLGRVEAEAELYEFVKLAWRVVEPECAFIDNWHIRQICAHLQETSHGSRINKLLINVPPGTMKSLLLSVFWPAWVWATKPEKRFFFASYAEDLAVRDSIKCNRLITSDWYVSLWPHLRLSKSTEKLFQNTRGGWRMSSTVGGKATGHHPDFKCLHPDTELLTSSGWLPIKFIVENRLNIKVASRSPLGTTEWKSILTYRSHPSKPCVKIRTKAGASLVCTTDHPVLVPGRGYKSAIDLNKGDLLSAPPNYSMIGKTVAVCDVVESVQPAEQPELVYNIGVADNHNYFANGILTHNCVDDPHNAKQAESDTDRRNAITWWDGTMASRGSSRGARSVIVMQRLHSNDLSGHVLSKGGYVHICLPMRFEAASEITDAFGNQIKTHRMSPTPLGFVDPRKLDGELLWPTLFPDAAVKNLEAEMGIYHAAGQLQQRPAPREGGLFKRAWFKTLLNAIPSDIVKWVRYWDKAGTDEAESKNGARTAGVLIGMRKGGRYLVADCKAGRWGAVDREAVIAQTAALDRQKYGSGVETWTEQEPGSGGKESAEATIRNLAGFIVKAEPVRGDKVTRAEPFASQAYAGNIDLLIGDWLNAYLDELEVFPAGRCRDVADASSGGFNKLHESKIKALIPDNKAPVKPAEVSPVDDTAVIGEGDF